MHNLVFMKQNHNYTENKNLGCELNQYYMRNKILVRETKHDYK
jgi:hypothetical protein